MLNDKNNSSKVKIGDGFFYKMYRAFIKTDLETIRENVIQEVIIPTIAETLVDAITSGVSMLFGVKPRRSGVVSRTYGSTSYSRNYPIPLDRANSEVKTTSVTGRPIEMRSFNAAEYIIRDRGLAESALIDLIDSVNDFGFATVGQFLDDIGLAPDSTTYNYGWSTLDDIDIEEVPGGYILTLPKPVFDSAHKRFKTILERTKRS